MWNHLLLSSNVGIRRFRHEKTCIIKELYCCGKIPEKVFAIKPGSL